MGYLGSHLSIISPYKALDVQRDQGYVESFCDLNGFLCVNICESFSSGVNKGSSFDS
jgi:hypothetical protein